MEKSEQAKRVTKNFIKNQELETINNAIHCMKVGADLTVCEDCNLYECTHADAEDLARIAIKALEKQIPKMVVEVGKYGFKCPCCNEELDLDKEDVFIYDMPTPKHCKHCGQALDWPDWTD